MEMKDDFYDVNEMIDVEEDAMKDKYLTFRIADEDYAVEIRYVTEIIGIQKITQLPEMPNFIKGVINLRGQVIPVIDVRLRFKVEEKEYEDRTCIIVVNVQDVLFGLIVDTVSEVLNIENENISPPPKSNFGHKNKYIQGIGKAADSIKIILNLNKIFSENEMDDLSSLSEE